MSTWIIGDIHGAFKTLKGLLSQIGAQQDNRKIVLIGDLVNRGPRSLEVLQWAVDQGDRVISLLGNHDLYYLARGLAGCRPKKSDTLEPLLDSPDALHFLEWMRRQPVLLQLSEKCHAVHAGIHPSWSLTEAEGLARSVEALLRSERLPGLLQRIFARPTRSPEPKDAVVATALRTFLTIRACRTDGSLHGFAGTLSNIPENLFPWFDHPQSQRWATHFYFGHWAALGLYQGSGVTALDSGCGWQRQLTGMELETGRVVQQDYRD